MLLNGGCICDGYDLALQSVGRDVCLVGCLCFCGLGRMPWGVRLMRRADGRRLMLCNAVANAKFYLCHTKEGGGSAWPRWEQAPALVSALAFRYLCIDEQD